MAQKVSVSLVDDLDGGNAVETVRFALDGDEYQIDLGRRNAEHLRAAMSAYIASGRRLVRTTGARSRTVVQRRVEVAADPRAVRAWARSNRVPLPERGRIPFAVLEQYRAAGH